MTKAMLKILIKFADREFPSVRRHLPAVMAGFAFLAFLAVSNGLAQSRTDNAPTVDYSDEIPPAVPPPKPYILPPPAVRALANGLTEIGRASCRERV